jgi:acyl-CoA synthetase (AMP-forming)/AMP-acid ligase II
MPAGRSLDSRPHVSFVCLPHLLHCHATRIPDAPAILAPGRVPLTYGRLYQHIDETRRVLRGIGIGRHDRVAVVLPNGPEMAVAILAVAASAACIPINPAYQAEELNRYFTDLRPRALIVEAGINSSARRVAQSRKVSIIELSIARDREAGLFTLSGENQIPLDDWPDPADVALLLLTSGTTARPKIVPLNHANLCSSACNSVAALALTETDCGINMLPLFHGHGLNNNVLASLAAGASIVCTSGFESNNFFEWLTTFQATWFSAVPTMHQAVLAQARQNRVRAADHRLRFIRSASAPLPPRLLAELEQTFETPVIESYGMTETASSFIACNPLPPRQRKPGSVGVPVGLDVAIMNEEWALLPRGQSGEVVVRGPTIMGGYDGDPKATEAAFANDWFKTGDLGFFDDDGYLFLAGRVREMINRGGEKIAPQEVDEVLLQHPAVAEAATFAVPHATLGEDVASAVVLRPDALAELNDIRRFAIGRIADFKIPRRLFIVGEIPKGPTGKVQRVGLAAKLGLATSTVLPPGFAAPRTPLEEVLAKRWAEILQVEQIGIHDDFFGSGGDSLLVAYVLSHVYEIAQVQLEVSLFFEAPTVAEVAHHIERLIQARPRRPSSAIVRVDRKDGIAPASLAQERLWKLQHALLDLPFFNILHMLRLTSPCDLAILERSLNEIVRRHEILRTTLALVEGRYVQVIAPQLTVTLAYNDLRPLPHADKERGGHQLIQEEALHSFDLAKGPMIRARVIHLEEQEYLLLFSMHQAVCDGRSLGVFIEELTVLYDAFSAGEGSPLAPLSYQYAEFAHWQRQWRSHPEMLGQLAYWREQLREPLPPIRLATSGAGRTVHELYTERRRWSLPASLANAARRFGQREGATLFMALVAALKILLHRYLGQDDLRVATNVANRNRPGTEALIGPLANTVILRTNLGGDPSPQAVLRRVRATTLAAFDRQDLPFEELAEALACERAIRPESLAEIMILLQNATLRPRAKFQGALACEEANPNMIAPLVTTSSFSVILALVETNLGLGVTCIYKPHLFSAEAIDRLLRDFESVLEQIVSQPERPISTIRVFGMSND